MKSFGNDIAKIIGIPSMLQADALMHHSHLLIHNAHDSQRSLTSTSLLVHPRSWS